MRIGIIAPPWLPVPPPAYGGTEQVIDSLARGLTAAGDEVLLFATGDSSCPVELRWELPTAVGTAGINPAVELAHTISAYDAMQAWGAELVHDHTLCGPVFARGLDLPVVTTNHGEFDGELGSLYRAIGGDVAVVAISRSQARVACATRIAAVIHHGIDVAAHPEGSGGGGYALFLGRLSPTKGVHIAARAAREAGRPLLVAAKMAEPAERAYFERAVAPLLGDGVEFLGEVGFEEKVRLLAGATCLLNPIQWSEPFGLVMAEALACGTPVVATPMGSVPEIVDDGRTGFIRSSMAGLVGALTEVGRLDRQACRTAALERFSVERMVADHRRLFRTLVDQRPRSLRVNGHPRVDRVLGGDR